MNNIIHQIINYLNYRSNVTVISFPNDGVTEVISLLKKETANPRGYDLSYLFIPVSYLFLSDHTLLGLENEVNSSIQLNCQNIDSLIDALKQGLEIVILADDLDLLENVKPSVDASDALVKKYGGKLRIIYLLEDPMIISQLQSEVMSYSTIFDAIIYNKLGENWNTEELTKACIEQFKRELPKEVVIEISKKSFNHFGIFKKLYQDKLMDTNNTEVYIESLLNDFKTEEINTLKKIVTKRVLDDKELKIKEAFKNINFINKNDEVSIPIVAERILTFRISGKIDLDSEDLKLSGIDLDLLTKTERNIIEELLKLEEVTKEEIAKIIWGEKINEYYSEWAIDQRISRLKRKLMDLGFNIDIKTLYGKGYKLIKL